MRVADPPEMPTLNKVFGSAPLGIEDTLETVRKMTPEEREKTEKHMQKLVQKCACFLAAVLGCSSVM